MKRDKNEIKTNAALLNVIAPLGLNFTKNTFSIGEHIARCYGISYYPSGVKMSWLAKITGMNDTICAITFTPTNNSELLTAISKQISSKRSEAEVTKDALTMKRAIKSANDSEEMIEKIDFEGETVGMITVSVISLGKEEMEFAKQCRKVEGKVASLRCKLRALPNLQKESFAHASPAFCSNEKINDILKRIMPLSTFIGGFPFSTTGLNDEAGHILGKDSNGSPVIVDIWKRGEDRINGNFVVMGLPGVGKSTTVKTITFNEFMQGTKIIIIDPQSEYKDLCKNLEGDWINLSGGGSSMINPLQVRPMPADEEQDEERLNDLALHLKNLELFFSLYIPSITEMQMAALKKELIALYKLFHIEWGTDVSSIPPDKFPTMSDLYDRLETVSKIETANSTAYKELTALLYDIGKGADSFLWSGYTNLHSNNDFICIDTSTLNQMSNNVKSTQYFNILTYAWEQMSRDRTTKYMLVCDEAYLMIDERVPQSLVYMRNFAKQARKYEASIGIISHSLSDFLSPSIRQYGEALLDLPCYRILMGTDGKNLKETADLYNLTEAEQALLLAKRRGQALLIAGNKRLKVQIDIPEYKLEYFGTAGGR